MSSLELYFEPLLASKAERLKALKFVHSNPKNYRKLFALSIADEAKRTHVYAAWVWELYLLEDLQRLTPYWPKLLQHLDGIKNSSMRRVHSKMVWLYLKEQNRYQSLSSQEKKKLSTSLLDWIIHEKQTAPLSFSIRVLGLLGKESPKLKSTLEELLIQSKRTFPKGVYPAIRTVFKD
jgi:hypothetical protein